ncbi:hypothetical protein ScPMuIL_009244 [Solemya velum]
MKHHCSLCDKKYVWVHDLSRHVKTKHDGKQSQQDIQQQRDTSFDYLEQQQQQQQSSIFKKQQQKDFVFQHPLTCIVTGPTCCGKTYFLTELLQKIKSKIRPCPQRITWLYKRWQPLYDVILKTVVPRVEFIKGVPVNLEQDSFLNPAVRNLIVLDDMVTEAAKDLRVTDLFTEGSHHRNLSVIALNQNLYFSKDPTQRRNCHYLVLFNNPVDKQPIMSLARQMFPAHPKILLRCFEEAVSQPYGNLVIDLKPTTPEHLRMRTDIFRIKGDKDSEYQQFESNNPPVQSITEDQCKKLNTSSKNTLHTREEGIPHSTMPSCDDCGLIFENNNDLQNHVRRWCSVQNNFERRLSDEEYIPCKRMRYSESDTDESDEPTSDGDRENEVYSDLAEKVKTLNETKWLQKVAKYESEGMDTNKAKEKADVKLREEDLQAFISGYGMIISYILKLNGGFSHSKIMNKIENFMERNVDEERAIRMVLRKYKHHFEEFLDNEHNGDGSDSDDTDSVDGSDHYESEEIDDGNESE